MLSNRKSRISALLSLLLLPLALLAGLIACKPSKLSNSTVPNVPKAETPIALSPGILAFINGTWEGTLGDPLGWSMRFDCFAQDGIQKVLLSVISKDFQTFYLPVNYNIEGDGLQLWWNDENNRGTVKLRFGWGRQVVATVSQLQRGTASGTFTKTSDTPKDGAVSYHGAWEGTLGDPLGWSVRFDCFAQSGIQRVLASIASDEWNAHFFPVNHALESDGLQLWWNDEANRQKIKLQFNQSGQLTGELFNRQGQQKAEGVFSRTSATPTDGGFHVKPQDNFIRHLRSYNGFGRSDAGPVVFEYDYSHSKLTELKEKYNLTSVAGVGDTQSKAIKLLNWLCKGTHHKNYNFGEMNSLALLEYAYGKGADKGLNCYNLSVILSEMCLSAGIQARALWLYPMNPNDGDNHVVVMAWIPERDKWIMLDPSFNAYFSDSGGNALSPDEIRDMIAQGGKINLNQDSKIDYSQYLNYMAKDMFYFNSSRKTGFGTFSGPIELIYFCPDGFDLADWRVKNARFRNTFDNPLSAEELAKREENMRQAKYIYATPESFWGK